MTDLTIRKMTAGERDHVTALLAAAFLEGPVADWLIVDRTARYRVFIPYFRIYVDYVWEQGSIYVADRSGDGLVGAALWMDLFNLPPHDQTAVMGEIPDYDQKLASACGLFLERFQKLDAVFARLHPKVPHYYLWLLGVSPDYQNIGIGSALIQHMADQTGAAPFFLEASNERNRALYLRHGFTGLDEVSLPEGGPPIWGMWRQP